MTEESVEIEARLLLVDLDCDPALITERLGIQPTKTWKAGDDRAKSGSGLKFENNGWRLDSGLPISQSIDEHVGAILERLTPGWTPLKALSKSCHVELAISITLRGGASPILGFDDQTVRRLAEINANIDVDIVY